MIADSHSCASLHSSTCLRSFEYSMSKLFLNKGRSVSTSYDTLSVFSPVPFVHIDTSVIVYHNPQVVGRLANKHFEKQKSFVYPVCFLWIHRFPSLINGMVENEGNEEVRAYLK